MIFIGGLGILWLNNPPFYLTPPPTQLHANYPPFPRALPKWFKVSDRIRERLHAGLPVEDAEPIEPKKPLGARTLLPRETPTPTPLALENIDRPIRAGDDLRDYYPVLLELAPAGRPSRVFPVQQREVEVAEWLFDSDPDVASAVLGLVVRPVLGIPYTPDNAAFLDAMTGGDEVRLRMSTRQTGSDREGCMGQCRSIRVTVRLDAEHDADLIAWLASIPPGSRSTLIRGTWRRGPVEAARWEPVDIEELRRVVAEELDRALAGKHVEQDTGEPTQLDSDLEAKYGEKLDRMLGGLGGGGEDD